MGPHKERIVPGGFLGQLPLKVMKSRVAETPSWPYNVFQAFDIFVKGLCDGLFQSLLLRITKALIGTTEWMAVEFYGFLTG